MLEKQIKELLKSTLSEERYLHSIGTMKMCEKLASTYRGKCRKS